MPIARMQKIRIVGLKRQRRQVLNLLQELGLVQVEEFSAEGAGLEREVNYDTVLSEIEFAITFLESFSAEKEGFLASFATSREPVAYHVVKARVRRAALERPARQCRELEAELMNINDLTKNLLRERDLLKAWVGLDATLEDLAHSAYVTYFAGAMPLQNIEDARAALENKSAALQVISSTKLGGHVLVAASGDSKDDVNQILSERGFSPVRLPVSRRTPAEEMGKIDASLNKAEERREDLFRRARELAKGKFDLMIIHDFFLQRKAAQGAEKKLALTTYTFMVEGWTPKRELGRLRKKITSFFPESLVVSIESGPDEVPPVAIENNPILKPFEAVSGIYGLPAYKEVDPTPLLATFFIIFFGLCLGDAGYGITLFLVAYIFYKKAGPASSARKLLKLLMFGGVITFIAGVVTGGWFGVDPASFPAFLKPARDLLFSIRIIDPVKNPIGMLVIALSFGVVQIIFGILVDFYVKVRDGAYLDAVLDDLLWIYFLLILVGFVVQKSGAMHITDKIGYLVIGGAAALVLTQGRKQKNPVFKLGVGILSLYKTVGYLSDTLSYSRILALGMATSIIAMVVNMVAMMTKDSVPVLGYVIMAIVLIAGHTFNLAVNVLGSFIHSARLQFVEFFSKFLAGGGSEFKPFRRESKFVEIK